MLQWIRIGRPWFKASANSLFCRRAEKRAIVFRHGSEMCRSQSTHTSTWRSSTIQIKSYGWPPKARQWLCTQRCQHATRQRNSWSSLLLAFGHLNSFDISVRSFESFWHLRFRGRSDFMDFHGTPCPITHGLGSSGIGHQRRHSRWLKVSFRGPCEEGSCDLVQSGLWLWN